MMGLGDLFIDTCDGELLCFVGFTELEDEELTRWFYVFCDVHSLHQHAYSQDEVDSYLEAVNF